MILTVPSTQTLASTNTMGSSVGGSVGAVGAVGAPQNPRLLRLAAPGSTSRDRRNRRQGSESQEEVATGTSIISNLIAQSIFRGGSRVCCG